MKKLFVGMILIFGLLIGWSWADAAVLYQEDFQDGVANGVSGMWLITEDGNTFIRSATSAGTNIPIYLTQTFQGDVSIEYRTRNNGRYDIGIALVGSNWTLFWFSDIGYYSPYPVIGSYGVWSSPDNHRPEAPYIYPNPMPYVPFPLAYQWYDIKVTFENGISGFYVNGGLIAEYDFGSLCPSSLTEPFGIRWLTWGSRDVDDIVVKELVTIQAIINVPNTISKKGNGKLPVTILSTLEFDASTMVDESSLTFGATGDEQSLAFCGIDDANYDGLPDLVCHFHKILLGLEPGDDIPVILKGKTIDGDDILGSKVVRVK